MSDREELANILLCRELLLDRRIILVLPDNSKETLELGHSLRPRYIAFVQGDYSDVSFVLGKMLTNREAKVQE